VLFVVCAVLSLLVISCWLTKLCVPACLLLRDNLHSLCRRLRNPYLLLDNIFVRCYLFSLYFLHYIPQLYVSMSAVCESYFIQNDWRQWYRFLNKVFSIVTYFCITTFCLRLLCHSQVHLCLSCCLSQTNVNYWELQWVNRLQAFVASELCIFRE